MIEVTQRVIISKSNDFVRNALTDAALEVDRLPPLLGRCSELAALSEDKGGCPCLAKFAAMDVDAFNAFSVAKTLLEPASKYVFREPLPIHPPAADPYRVQQNYLDIRECGGIDLAAADGFARGKVKLVDIEQGWTIDHEEFQHLGLKRPDGINRAFHGHGTAVIGVLAAKGDNKRGIAGILPEHLEICLVSEYWNDNTGRLRYNTAEAICFALHEGYVGDGDILMIQSQYFHESGLILPVEANPLVRCAIECAVRRGVVVIEPAGNGGVNLDHVAPAGTASDAKPSGAILVAAATSDPPHRPLFFSNRGRSVQCFAWGEDVTTCGDGETSKDRDDYTANFRGTSAAAAIVAGVAALIQSVARGRNQPLTGKQLRELITCPDLGTPAARGSDPIGHMPDVKKLIKRLVEGPDAYGRYCHCPGT